MAKEKEVKKENGQSQGQLLVNAISAAVEKGFGSSLKPFIDAQKETNQQLSDALKNISASQEELVKGLHELALGNVEAAIDDSGKEVKDINAAWPKKGADATMASDATDATMSSARKSDATDSTDDSTSDDATDSTDDDVNADAQAVSSVDPTNHSDPDQNNEGSGSTPGDLNEDATANARAQSKGGSNQMKPGGASSSPAIAASHRRKTTSVADISAAARAIRTLQAEREQLREERSQLIGENKKLRNRVGAIEASLERYAERVERKSVTPEISALMEKSGYDVRELMSSKQRLSVNDVDTMLANSGVGLEPSMRAAFKNQLLQLGLMETGEVRRYQ